jgi:hypothetical protein
MLRALCLAMTILARPLGSAYADAPPEPGSNAALKYWQAFAELPRFTDAEGEKLIAECLTMPLDAHAREIVSTAEYALEMMHEGAALPHCDWGIGYEAGIYVRLPHGSAARVLSSLAYLRARMRFEEGRNAEALEDIVAAMTLARHVSQDGTLIIVLFGYSIEPRMSETLARYLPKLDGKIIKDLKRRLDALPAGGRPATAMQFEERSFLDWFVRTVKDAKDNESLLDKVSLLFYLSEEGGARSREKAAAKARTFLEECGGTADGVLQRAEEVRPCYALMATKLDLPLDQFEKEFEREAMKRTGNPVFALCFSALPKCRRAQARTDVRRALLAAALAVQLGGRDALKDHPDPLVGGPFHYVAFEGGFELRSELKLDDKPLALTVGRRAK